MKQVTIAGMGPGSAGCMTQEVLRSDGPNTQINSPFSISRLTFSSAVTLPFSLAYLKYASFMETTVSLLISLAITFTSLCLSDITYPMRFQCTSD